VSFADTGRTAEAPVNLRRLGRLRVLQALTDAGEHSRASLTRRTGLARATVSSVIFDLIGEGLVREQAAQTTETKLGRPPLTLSLVPSAAYVVGVDVAHDHVRTILSDLVGTPIWDVNLDLDVDASAEDALVAATKLIDRALRETNNDQASVLGIGVGIACPVDRRSGQLRAEGIMPGWVGIKPGEELAARTGLSAQVINDANACVLAERRYGAAQTWDDVVYVRLSSGIGAGVVCDGRMLLGHDGLAGEVGHVTIEPNGAVCRCGNRGCLETIASPTAIAALLSRSWARTVTSAELFTLVHARDRGAVRALEDAGEAIGRALAMTVMILNPRLIVVGGELAVAGDTLLNPMRRVLQRNSVSSHHRHLEISLGALGDSAAVRGAAALALTHAPQQLSERASTHGGSRIQASYRTTRAF
jgi:predicted NBD/HSP70 family sugar kinase